MGFFYNFITCKIFLNAERYFFTLWYMAKHLLGWSPCHLGQVSQQNDVSLLPPFTIVQKQTAQSFFTFPSCAWIRCSIPFSQSSTSVNLVYLSFESFCFKRFLTIVQSHSYKTPGEKKIGNFTDCKFILYKFFAHIYYFQMIFLQTNLH
jgi:hypothetical protein